jgi:hypothetical protein
VQAAPLTVNAVGAALELDQVPWTPKDVDAPAATLPL